MRKKIENKSRELVKSDRSIWKRFVGIKKENPEIGKELKETRREILKDIDEDDRKSGDWFYKLLKKMLHTHATNVTYEFYRNKYHSDIKDVLAKRIISSYENYSIAIGALMGAAGGFGGVPSAIVSAFPEIATLSYYQLRMIYDLSLVFDRPINLDDPGEVAHLFKIAFGIKSAELMNKGVMAGIEKGIQVAGRELASEAGVKLVQSILKEIGIKITQKAIRNTVAKSIPIVGAVVGSAACASFNYLMTRNIAARILNTYRTPGLVWEVFESRNTITDSREMETLVKGCWVVANANRVVSINKTCLIEYIYQKGLVSDRFVCETRERTTIPEEEFYEELSTVKDFDAYRSILYAMIIIALMDRKISVNEMSILVQAASQRKFPKRALRRMISQCRESLFKI